MTPLKRWSQGSVNGRPPGSGPKFWEFPQIWRVAFWCPDMRDPIILGPYQVPLNFWRSQMSAHASLQVGRNIEDIKRGPSCNQSHLIPGVLDWYLKLACASACTWTSKRAQSNGPISPNRECRQYRVHYFGRSWSPGSPSIRQSKRDAGTWARIQRAASCSDVAMAENTQGLSQYKGPVLGVLLMSIIVHWCLFFWASLFMEILTRTDRISTRQPVSMLATIP